jgi:hypothetical protein
MQGWQRFRNNSLKTNEHEAARLFQAMGHNRRALKCPKQAIESVDSPHQGKKRCAVKTISNRMVGGASINHLEVGGSDIMAAL